MYEEKSSAKEILARIFRYLKEDKRRCIKILVYVLYLWFLKYKLFSLLGAYFKLIFNMSPMKIVKIVYNAFIIMLILELGFEEYSRIKAIIRFFKKISVSLRVKSRVFSPLPK